MWTKEPKSHKGAPLTPRPSTLEVDGRFCVKLYVNANRTIYKSLISSGVSCFVPFLLPVLYTSMSVVRSDVWLVLISTEIPLINHEIVDVSSKHLCGTAAVRAVRTAINKPPQRTLMKYCGARTAARTGNSVYVCADRTDDYKSSFSV